MEDKAYTSESKQIGNYWERGKKVGIVHLEMVKEERSLYGLERFSKPEEIVDMVRPLLERSDREMVVVVSLSIKLEPLAVEVVAIGGLDACTLDVKNIFKHSIMNNAGGIVCIHNHPSGDAGPSGMDEKITEQLCRAGAILSLPLMDHIIIGRDSFYSFRENGKINSDMEAGTVRKTKEEDWLHEVCILKGGGPDD